MVQRPRTPIMLVRLQTTPPPHPYWIWHLPFGNTIDNSYALQSVRNTSPEFVFTYSLQVWMENYTITLDEILYLSCRIQRHKWLMNKKESLYANSQGQHVLKSLPGLASHQEWALLHITCNSFQLGWCPSFLKTSTHFCLERPTWSKPHDHLSTLDLPSQDLKPDFLLEGKNQKNRTFHTGCLRLSKSTINTNVKFTVVHYEVIQCYCYLT